MFILLSPTKKQQELPSDFYREPFFNIEADRIIRLLMNLDKSEITKLYKISPSLAESTSELIKNWKLKGTTKALYCFCGESFRNISAKTLDLDCLTYLNNNLIIFSGLYGVLRPNDTISCYRLDVENRLFLNGQNLSLFWKERITQKINSIIHESGKNLIINLASKEYFNLIDLSTIQGKIITPVFNLPSMALKSIRGEIVRQMAIQKIETEEELLNLIIQGKKLKEKIVDLQYYP